MGLREQLQRKIEKKQEEIGQMHFQISQQEAYLQALQDVLSSIPKDDGAPRDITLRHGTAVAKARDAILAAGKPLHVSEILKAIGKEDTKDGRISLGGSLSAYVRRREVFTRPEPNTFGLIEMALESISPKNGELIPLE